MITEDSTVRTRGYTNFVNNFALTDGGMLLLLIILLSLLLMMILDLMMMLLVPVEVLVTLLDVFGVFWGRDPTR